MPRYENLEKRFKELAATSALSHGYIFFGEDGVEQVAFAKMLANYLETGLFEISHRPLNDALLIVPNEHNTIGIDEARVLKSFLMSRPAVGKKRTVIINRGETLTPEAQNAILKIAEEPPEKALLIINLKDAESLLPTVLSRFQKIYFGKAVESRENARVSRGTPSARDFLRATPSGRSAFIKNLLESEVNKSELADRFLDELVLEMHADLPRYAKALVFVLNRKRLMNEYNTNSRLQLEAIAKMI